MYEEIFERLSPCSCGCTPQIAIDNKRNSVAVVCEHCRYEARAESAEMAVELWEHVISVPELRYNPYHDPTNGRFTSSGGAGGGYLFVGKGQKGKGSYVVDSESFSGGTKTIDIDSTNDEAFQKNTHELLKEQDYKPKRYKELLDNGDFDNDEYQEAMSTVLTDVKENQVFQLYSEKGVHNVKGTTFRYNNSKYGIGRVNGKDFVTDIKSQTSIPVRKKRIIGFGEVDDLSNNIINSINVMNYLNSLQKRAFDNDKDDEGESG